MLQLAADKDGIKHEKTNHTGCVSTDSELTDNLKLLRTQDTTRTRAQYASNNRGGSGE